MLTEDNSTIIVYVTENWLSELEKNIVYKNYGLRVSAKQNIHSFQLDEKSIKLIELIEYNPVYDKKSLNRLIQKATPKWKGIDAEAWLQEIRGTNEIGFLI